MTGRVLRLEDRGVRKTSNLKTGAPDEREAHQRPSPPHARGHGRAQVRREDPATTISATSRASPAFLGRSPDTATAEDVRRFQVHLTESGRAAADDEQLGLGAALLLRHDARPRRAGPASRPRALPQEAAARALARGGGPPAGSGTRPRPQVQGGPEHRLWRRPAGSARS